MIIDRIGEPDNVLEVPDSTELTEFDIDIFAAVPQQELEVLFEELKPLQSSSRSNYFKIDTSRVDPPFVSEFSLSVRSRRHIRRIETNIAHIHLTSRRRRLSAARARSTRLQKQINNMAAFTKALAIASPISQESRWNCIGYGMLDIDKWSPVISLPILRVNIPGTPFVQISGIRLTPESHDMRNHLVLDLRSEKELFVLLGFEHEGAISVTTFREIAEEAQGYLSRSVMPKETEVT